MTERQQRLTVFGAGIFVLIAMVAMANGIQEPADGTRVTVRIPRMSTIVAPGAALHPDSARLRTFSELAGVPVALTFAVAWQETRNNARDSTVRSSKGALGRFQIMDATARSRCPRFDVRTPDGNLACFLKMIREDAASSGDYGSAARIHNGRGYAARAFADTVLMNTGRLYLYWETVR